MNFYREYDRFVAEVGNSLNETQTFHLKNLYEAFVEVKSQNDDSNNFVDGLEKQKEKLDKDISRLRKKRDKLSANIRAKIETENQLKSEIQSLNSNKKELEELIDELDSSFRSKAVGKGIYERKHGDAIELISEIHKYTLINRCWTKESLGKNIRKKTSSNAVKVCGKCGRFIKYCECKVENLDAPTQKKTVRK